MNVPLIDRGVAVEPFGVIRFPSARSALDYEDALLTQTSLDGLPRAAVWSTPPAIVVSRRDAQTPGFHRAHAWAQARSLELAVRRSGGSAVLLGPDTLTLTLVTAQALGAPLALDAPYEDLRALLQGAARPYDVAVSLGARDGAFCDGRHNLLADGRKVAGTAQLVRSRAYSASLAHAAILVYSPGRLVADTLNSFYKALFIETAFDPAAAASLMEVTPRRRHRMQLAAFNRGIQLRLCAETHLWLTLKRIQAARICPVAPPEDVAL